MKTIFTIALTLQCLLVTAQSDLSKNDIKYKNSIQASAGMIPFWGAAQVSYERILVNYNSKIIYAFGLGATYGTWFEWTGGGPYVAISAKTLLFRGNHHFEATIGQSALIETKHEDEDENNKNPWEAPYFRATISGGYRYQKPDGRLIIRTGIGYPEAIYLGVGLAF